MERHRTDPVSLVFGVLFALVGLAFLLRDVPAIPDLQLRWVGPLLVLALGLWVLASASLSSSRPSEDEEP